MKKELNINSLRLVIWNILSVWAKTVFKIFLNIYLWKETNDIQILAIFNIMFLLWHWISFWFLSSFVKLWYRRIIYFLSLSWFILSYLFLIFLWEQVINYIYLIWFIFWIFNWSYFITYNVNQFDLTTFKNRWNFEWIKRSLKMLSQILFPALFWLIIWLYDINLAFIIGIVLFILSYFIWDVSFKYSKWKTNYKAFLKIILLNKKILFSIVWSFFFTFAFSIQLLWFIIPLLIYNEVWTEIKLWFSLSFLSILSIIIVYIFWRFMDYKHYNKSFIILTFLYIVSLFWLLFTKSYSMLIFLSWVITATIQLCTILLEVITNNSLHLIKNYDKFKVEFLTFKEWWYILWWISSLILLYFSWSFWQESLKIVFYTMIIFSIISTLFLIKIKIHEIEKYRAIKK